MPMTFSGNNRTHMIRIPAGGRFELRLADGAANPYLLQAGILAAGLDGLRHKHDPANRSTSTCTPKATARRTHPGCR